MGIRKRLWDWCQKPKKQDSHFLARLAIWFHFPKVRIPQVSLPLNLISFLASLPLTYAGTDFFYCLITGRYIDLRDQFVILVLFWIPFFFAISWIVTDFTLSKLKREGRKVLLFSTLLLIIVPAGLAAGLNNGVFDHIIIEDSVLDLYNCKAVLNVRNIGLTDIRIKKIEIGDLVCDFSSKQDIFNEPYLKRGEYKAIVIYYANELYEGGSFDSNLNVTPTTFREGKYPVVIHIDGITAYKSEIEAKFSKKEEIYGVRGESSLYMLERSYWLPRIKLTFKMAPESIVSIYSITIGNLTLTFKHPVYAYGDENTDQNSITLYPDYGHYYTWGIHHEHFEYAFPNQPLDSQIFKDGETYSLTVRTMANNNYTGTIIIKQ